MHEGGASPVEIARIASGELDAVILSRPCFNKLYITAHPAKDGEHFSMFENLGDLVCENDATIVAQDVFGSCELYDEGMAALKRACGSVEWPVTWVQGGGSSASSLTGTQAYAISGTSLLPIRLDGRVVGSMFEDEDTWYCLLGHLEPDDISCARRKQARATFEKMEVVLAAVDMDFSNVVRTWMYIDAILSWYDEFNEVRNEFFKERGVFEGVVPASTGIGVGNPAGAALVADLLAVKPKSGKVNIHSVASPLQGPAIDYKSSFSRAVEVVLSDHRRLYISGTASIEPEGATAHPGDVTMQIARTVEVVEAILESREMGWTDVSRAIAYFRDIENAPLLDSYCVQNGLPSMPIAVAHGDICRDDLQFEIEVEAVTVSRDGGLV